MKDLTQEQMNQLAARLVHSKHMIDDAKDWAAYTALGEDYSPKASESLGFELLDEPEVTIHYEGSSSGAGSFWAEWEGVFLVDSPGLPGVRIRGKASLRGEELWSLDPDLFYFEDQESHSEE